MRICRFICGLALAGEKKRDAKRTRFANSPQGKTVPAKPLGSEVQSEREFPVERFALIDFERNTLTRYANGKPSERYEITGQARVQSAARMSRAVQRCLPAD